jgi:4-hydroxymandelate synthase
MAVLDVEYVELYTSDHRSALHYFTSSFGFTRVAESADHGRTSTLLRQGPVQLVLTAGAGTEDFLDTHGDGVADIAFSCDDVPKTCDAALASGASVKTSPAGLPRVAGFGDVSHTLMEQSNGNGNRMPLGYSWSAAPAMSGRPAGRIKKLDHVAVCLEASTLHTYADLYRDAFALARYSSEYIEVGDQAMDSVVVRSDSGGVTFTFLEQDMARQAGQVDAFISRSGGPGVQHLAFAVDDIIGAVQDFRHHGVEFLSTPDAYYEMLAERLPDIDANLEELRDTNVLADRDEWGYLLQLFTRSPYERNTMFYELIQRRGARGFGSANIRALYEAVERDGMIAELLAGGPGKRRPC